MELFEEDTRPVGILRKLEEKIQIPHTKISKVIIILKEIIEMAVEMRPAHSDCITSWICCFWRDTHIPVMRTTDIVWVNGLVEQRCCCLISFSFLPWEFRWWPSDVFGRVPDYCGGAEARRLWALRPVSLFSFSSYPSPLSGISSESQQGPLFSPRTYYFVIEFQWIQNCEFFLLFQSELRAAVVSARFLTYVQSVPVRRKRRVWRATVTQR